GNRVAGLLGNDNRAMFSGNLVGVGQRNFQTPTTPDGFLPDTLNVNLPSSGTGGFNPGTVAISLFNSSLTKFINLELTALETEGKGKIISSPRVLTANNVEALIEQGTELPYQQATSSGATSVAFRKANLALK